MHNYNLPYFFLIMNNNYVISVTYSKKEEKSFSILWGFSFLKRIVADPFNLMIKVSDFKNKIKNFIANKKK
jgi:hypothetical protein